VLGAVLSPEQLADWGWRVAFALGLIIVPVGLYIRRRLPETLMRRPDTGTSAGVIRVVWKPASGLDDTGDPGDHVHDDPVYVNNYMTTYALTTLGLPAFKAMWATLIGGAAIAVGALWSGQLSDRFGRKPLMIVSRVALVLVVYPAYVLLVNEKSLWALVSVSALLNLLSTLGAAAAPGCNRRNLPEPGSQRGLRDFLCGLGQRLWRFHAIRDRLADRGDRRSAVARVLRDSDQPRQFDRDVPDAGDVHVPSERAAARRAEAAPG